MGTFFQILPSSSFINTTIRRHIVATNRVLKYPPPRGEIRLLHLCWWICGSHSVDCEGDHEVNKAACFLLAICVASIMKMEAVSSFKTSLKFCRTSRRYIPEDSTLYLYWSDVVSLSNLIWSTYCVYKNLLWLIFRFICCGLCHSFGITVFTYVQYFIHNNF